MELILFLEKTLNDCANPCFVTDYETEALIFINPALAKRFQIFEPYQGKFAEDVFGNALNPEDYPQKNEIIEGEYTEKRIYSARLDCYLRANTAMLTHCGRKILLTKYFLTSEDSKREQAQDTFATAMTRCLEILANPDQGIAIENFLGYLCDFYQCETAFVSALQSEENGLSAQYYSDHGSEKSAAVATQRDIVLYKQFSLWLENDNDREDITLNLEDETLAHSELGFGPLIEFGFKNLTLTKLWNKDGTTFGILGMINRKEPAYDERLTKAVAQFVSDRFNEACMVKILKTLNETDLLTGFLNRNKYGQKLISLSDTPPKSLGVLFVNLNGLRKTNEYFGFAEGDAQIKKTTTQLCEFFDQDFYRISGDEFVGFMENWEKEPFELKVDELQKRLKSTSKEINFSIGHSWAEDTYDISELIKVADTVMIINKQSYYSNAVDHKACISDTILRDLFKSLAEDEFLVYLQPQVNLETKEVIGAEALIRRYDGEMQKMIFPDNFIPVYEKNSIIRHVDLFVIRKVCQILVDWGKFGKQLPISVNLSRVTLMEHGIVETITAILDEYQVSHDMIIMEITERVGLVENEVGASLIEEFKVQGFRLSLDDFGCAYSNIITLAQIEVDEVKIDKSLVDNLATSSKNRVIVRNILSMCQELDSTFALAEGIETQEQADFLRSANCSLGQGYLYSRPIPHEEFFKKHIQKQI